MVKLLRSLVSGPLEPHVEGFAEELLRQGYSRASAEQHVCFIAHLDRWMQAAGVSLGDLSGQVLEVYLVERRAAGYREYRSVKALRPLLDYLVRLGVVPVPPEVPLGPMEELLSRYRVWLLRERGLTAGTARGYVDCVRPFLVSRLRGDVLELASLTAADVTGFVLTACSGRAVGSAKLIVCALRYDVLEGHVALDVQCLDRIYLNGYVPNLQVGGQVVSFMTRHLGDRIPSPAILEKIGTVFRRSVNSFAEANHIPLIRFAKDDRKIDVMRRYMRAQERVGRSGVVAIGVAQEYQNVFASTQRQGTNGIPCFGFHKADRRVTCFYFYLWDADFGPAFIKICAYFPYPIKVWINGHEWAKRQATHAGIAFTELSNGFAACEDPRSLQEICDRLGPGNIEVFFQRWLAVLPLPLTDHDADAGYWWELSMRQVEISGTLVFDAPRHARGFFEALVADNLDIGRPDSVELIFTGHAPHSRAGRPVKVGTVC
ncbi:hypothetical protein [Arthrobacter sp. 24S4-2]|uniref:hypothetical protein n=1 Tax=Arthrobacter sp. 24S4-2 TaxID=2575374 RepID=UPI001C30DCD5|nr:hypothetical protein [Arthrobacter sp. 24S4-2]